MTLPELAALAAKVEGFVQPRVCCSLCRGTSLAWGTEPCFQCGCTGWTDDNSPAALLMAVTLCAKRRKGRVTVENGMVLASGFGVFGSFYGEVPEDSGGSIARAALVALLRAHGVEVADD